MAYDIYVSQGYNVQAAGHIIRWIGGDHTNAVTLFDQFWNYSCVAVDSNNDVFVAVNGGSLYKQTNGAGALNQIISTAHDYRDLICDENNDLYGILYSNGLVNTKLYKLNATQDGWIEVAGITASWWGGFTGMCFARNGDFYNTQGTDGIFCNPGGIGVGSFIAGTSGGVGFYALAASVNGDIYAASGGALYKRSAGSGSFSYITSFSQVIAGISVNENLDVYVSESANGFIYKQTGGAGSFEVITGSGLWGGMGYVLPPIPPPPPEYDTRSYGCIIG